MSKYVDALQQARHENRRLYGLFLVVLAAMFYAMWGWKTAPRHMTAHIPPDLRNGATLNVGDTPDVPDTTVYTFAFYIWQQINHWKTDGAKDYGQQIYALQHYVTPSCREQMVADMNVRNNAGELFRRTRAVMEIPGLGYTQERVAILGGHAWKVLLDTQVQETQNGVPVKDAYIRYPLHVVRFDVDREKNPWQLAIDCFGGERPARLDAKAVAVAQSGHTIVAVRGGTPSPAVPLASGAASTAESSNSAATAAPASASASGNGSAALPNGVPASGAGLPSNTTSTITPVTLPRPLN